MKNERAMELIQELMEELQGEMEYGSEDLDERLGRQKPAVEVMKIEGEMPMDDEMSMEEPEDEFDEEEGSFMKKNDPAMALKKRLMKLRS